MNGTPEELDAEFLQAISTPVQKAQGILTNLETFEKQAEQAASPRKGQPKLPMGKTETEKEVKGKTGENGKIAEKGG